MVVAGLLLYAASLEINHAHDHCAVRVEGQTLEPPSAIERALALAERLPCHLTVTDIFTDGWMLHRTL